MSLHLLPYNITKTFFTYMPTEEGLYADFKHQGTQAYLSIPADYTSILPFDCRVQESLIQLSRIKVDF